MTEVSIDAYYVGLNAEKGAKSVDPSVQPEQIDYKAFTSLIYFGIMLKPDTTFYWPADRCPDVATRTVKLAHEAGRKVTVSVGADADPGEGQNSRFRCASSDARRASFISELLGVVATCDFDGLDIDWEPVVDADIPSYEALIHDLRRALDKVSSPSRRLSLTAAVNSEPELFAKLQGELDRIDLMTYDLADESGDSPIWHNSPLYSGPTSPGDDPMPSADQMVQDFEKAGIAPDKLEIGIDLFGTLWTDTASQLDILPFPGQKWKSKPLVREKVPYSEVMDRFYDPSFAGWDDLAKAPYLSLIDPEGHPEMLVYEDTHSCDEKIKYSRQRGLRGVFVWELGLEWRPGARIPNPLTRYLKKYQPSS